MKRLLIIALLFGSTCYANTVYISAAGGTFSGGSACNGQTTQTPTYFNTSTNWTSGTPTGSQIGPGTLVMLCGTFTSSTNGGTLLTTQGNGTSANPIHILFDTGAKMNSTGWWGSSGEDQCPCTGAVNLVTNYITLDGGTTGTNTPNGIIQNMLVGTSGNTSCVSGTCTVSSAMAGGGSTLVNVTGNSDIIENLNLIHVYQNTSGTDTNGQYTWDIADWSNGSPVTNLYIYNNVLANASAFILDGSSSTGTPNQCPTVGLCVAWNTIQDHHWMAAWHGTGVTTYNNLYGGTGAGTGISNWFAPSGTYHQDGDFTWGPAYTTTIYSINNTYLFDLWGTSPSGDIYFANCNESGQNCGSAGVVEGDTLLSDSTGGSYLLTVGQSGGYTDIISGPIYKFNNTLIDSTPGGGNGNINTYFGNDSNTDYLTETFKNNIVQGAAGTQNYFWVVGGTYSVWAGGSNAGPIADYNLYYCPSCTPNWMNNAISTKVFATWQGSPYNEDTHSINGSSPVLTTGCTTGAANCTISSLSPAKAAGTNLYTTFQSLGIDSIAMIGPPQYPGASGSCGTGCLSRPTSGAWDIGAYPYSSSPTTYTLSTATAGAGTGTVTGCAGSYASGAAYSCTVAAGTGSTLSSVTGCSGSGTTTYSGTMPAAPCTVTATFTLNSYTLSTATTGSGTGTVTGCAGSVNYGATYSCTVTATGGSTLSSVSGCGGSGTTTYTGSMPASPCTVTATFAVATPPPPPPTNLVLQSSVSGKKVILTWTAPSGTLDYYRIGRSTSPTAPTLTNATGWTMVGTSGTPTYTDTGCLGLCYYVMDALVVVGGWGVYTTFSNVASATVK